jgi:hypothetical protein
MGPRRLDVIRQYLNNNTRHCTEAATALRQGSSGNQRESQHGKNRPRCGIPSSEQDFEGLDLRHAVYGAGQNSTELRTTCDV